jgi:hypothetical protein
MLETIGSYVMRHGYIGLKLIFVLLLLRAIELMHIE